MTVSTCTVQTAGAAAILGGVLGVGAGLLCRNKQRERRIARRKRIQRERELVAAQVHERVMQSFEDDPPACSQPCCAKKCGDEKCGEKKCGKDSKCSKGAKGAGCGKDCGAKDCGDKDCGAKDCGAGDCGAGAGAGVGVDVKGVQG